VAKQSRPVVREKKTAYQVRVDQRSDPKPKSKLARQLARLTPPKSAVTHRPGIRQPDRLLCAHDQQKAMEFADAPDVARVEAQPFLKWAGGKAQLLEQFDQFFPDRIDRYFEPFLGGGAVFFHLKRRFPGMRAFLRDNNAELINAYRAVQLFPHELMRRLDAHLKAFHADRERYYYLVRSRHQPPAALPGRARPPGAPLAVQSPKQTAGPAVQPYQQPIQDEGRWSDDIIVERAARFLFLNKTCFNGLYRVNARGEFNVPIGSHKNPALYDRDNLLAANWALRDAHLAVQDCRKRQRRLVGLGFRVTMNETRKGDFIYIDPPYYPLSATASFTSYTKEDFGGPEQEELAALFADAAGASA
jgi:DNA adenine methylase